MTRYKIQGVDQNQKPIVKALLDIPGVSVEVNHDDFLVGYNGRTYWFELKDPRTVSPKSGKIREKEKKKSQIKLEQSWTGHYRIVSTLEEILDDILPRRTVTIKTSKHTPH